MGSVRRFPTVAVVVVQEFVSGMGFAWGRGVHLGSRVGVGSVQRLPTAAVVLTVLCVPSLLSSGTQEGGVQPPPTFAEQLLDSRGGGGTWVLGLGWALSSDLRRLPWSSRGPSASADRDILVIEVPCTVVPTVGRRGLGPVLCVGGSRPTVGKRETGVSLPDNQRQHRTSHALKDVLLLRI